MFDDIRTNAIIGAAITVHRNTGPGLFERVYEECMAMELGALGIPFRRQVLMPMHYRGNVIPNAFRIDLLVANIPVEIKACSQTTEEHRTQLRSYMMAGEFEVGLLLNFWRPTLRDGIVPLTL